MDAASWKILFVKNSKFVKLQSFTILAFLIPFWFIKFTSLTMFFDFNTKLLFYGLFLQVILYITSEIYHQIYPNIAPNLIISVIRRLSDFGQPY